MACILQGVQKMKAAGRLAADVLEHAGSLVKVSPCVLPSSASVQSVLWP